MDEARRQTDKTLSEMEKKIQSMYAQSQISIRVRWDQYMAQVKPEADRLKAEYDAAIQNQKKKRGKNSLFVSSSAGSSGGSGINL